MRTAGVCATPSRGSGSHSAVAWPVTGLTWFVFQSERMWDAAMVLAGRAQPKAEAKHLEAAE